MGAAGASGMVRHCRGNLHAAFNWALMADFDYAGDENANRFKLKENPVVATKRPPVALALTRRRNRL